MWSSCFLTMFLLCSPAESEDVVRQRAYPDFFPCGPNAVYMLLKLEGHEVRFSDIMEGARVDSQGVSLMEVNNELEKFGVASEVIKCQASDLPRIRTPYIMYTYPPKSPGDVGHFVVVVSINDKTLQVLDATSGLEKTYQLGKITNIWDGMVIVPRRERSALPEIVFLIASFAFFLASSFFASYSRNSRAS